MPSAQALLRRRLFAARLYGILDTGYLAPDRFVPLCRALIVGGAGIIQVRAKRESRDAYRRLLDAVLPLFDGLPIPLIINDHLDIVLEYPGCGLHIGQDDVPVREARAALGPDRVLGLSTHSVAQAQGALQVADALTYFCIGPVFPTNTKPDYVPVGLQLVTEVTALAADHSRQNPEHAPPLFAIGGINRRNIHDVRAAGAGRVVVVSDILQAGDPVAAARAFTS